MIRTFTSEQFIETFIRSKNKAKSLSDDTLKIAKQVIDQIRLQGESALKEYVQKFEGYLPLNWEVTDEERKQAWSKVDVETITSLQKAADNIKKFHSKQIQQSKIMELTEDIIAGQLYRPIERVGIYVPGGTACYPSTVLMNAIPAVLAGVSEVIMTTPVREEDSIAPILSVAADISGVNKIYKIGGIQAIAALAYGTEQIAPVDKIVGPGNKYVAAAKSLVFGDVGIDMIAGPSEVAIIADETANPKYVAADLIAQAEHDENARTFLLTTSEKLINETKIEIVKQCEKLPRATIAKKSLSTQSASVRVSKIDFAFDLVNKLAPEHVEIQLENPLSYLSKVKNAGSIFLGSYTPEAIGDYFGGPNHVLPTSGTARFSSGLSVDDFMKKTTYLYYSEKALCDAAPHVVNIASEEKLIGHTRAVQVRLGKD
ncbi:histidinol dehydrogenase [Heyndrickxia sporothermodurans]|uniref:Histidinol dehydrogenase n=3 Tax=Heyndrickxia sporothermodurans TaxID=46224 RepID=A0A150L890_9BACI|nr:histidinol dehydrogenase [Heyndrickxia sporothermodurans]KYD08470.1 Histidinol dehydrogenase [Heyndrickxia sporothermodurans]MBL5767395.1 histidinol dehydrogenase [Heyndrickxia sporothermodurans]MBL5770745.1 histidinol dehydrogenase [Heyndrickxia sporothermodurans]MBL5777868.1 histidinol dehydrogenase [Heyndrickxia sporothermodurans]MBL5781771.1 histidinol dehydrogenase [Heyndrickxia sporothermodurans]